MDARASSREFVPHPFENGAISSRISEPEAGIRPGNRSDATRDSPPQRTERGLVGQIIPNIDGKKRCSHASGELAHRDAFPLNLARHDFPRVVALNYAKGTADTPAILESRFARTVALPVTLRGSAP